MTSDKFREFLERVKTAAEPGEIVLEVVQFVVDHPPMVEGGRRNAFSYSREVWGVLRDKDKMPLVNIGGFVSITNTIFDKYSGDVEKDGIRVSLEQMLAENALSFSPKGSFDVVRVQDDAALSSHIDKKDAWFSKKVFTELPRDISCTPSFASREADIKRELEILKLVDITVYLGKEAIVDHLVSKKQPFDLIRQFDELGIPIPQKLSEKATGEAEQMLRDLGWKAIRLLDAETLLQKKEEALRKEADHGAELFTTVRSGPTIDADDIHVMTLGRHKDLVDSYQNLSEQAKHLQELGITRFVKKVKFPILGLEMDVEKFFEGLERKSKTPQNTNEQKVKN